MTVGLALFAMFFGSGNLIYPMFLGQMSGADWPSVFGGLLLTAVVMPLMGVIAMVLYHGDYVKFFSCLGRNAGLLVIGILLTVWIPLGSGPRCIAVAYASMLPYVDTPIPRWLFSIGYSLLTLWIVYKKSRMLDVLGYVLTPVLLLSLAVIVFKGVDFTNVVSSDLPALSLFTTGIVEGYNTMDLIAAFFFSASIIEILRNSSHNEDLSLRTTIKASLVAAALLAVVYLGLICLSATHAEVLNGIPREQMLVHLSKVVLGSQLGMVASLAVFLACLTTSVALASVFTDFLAERLFGDSSRIPLALVVTQLFTYGMSITGLEGVTFITGPLLQIFYPLLLILIVGNVMRSLLARRQVMEAA
jgi:LIVCS family branched-chain amino acid:cation transporter